MGNPTEESRNDLLSRVADEFFAAAARGDAPSIDDFAERFPSIAEDIQTVFPALAAFGDPTEAESSELPNGHSSVQNLGDFRIIRELGRGGMGIVYEALQLSIGRRVALKVLPFAGMLDRQQLNRFKNEARAAGTLDHPNIVSVLFVGEDRGVHYYAMQLIEGRSLAEVIAPSRSQEPTPHGSTNQRSRCSSDQRNGQTADWPTTQVAADARGPGLVSTLPDNDSRSYCRAIARLGCQAAEALDHAHNNGVVHRDMKPANLLLDADGKLWVTDFGLAQIESDTNLTMTGDLVGTLRYMSPEQVLGRRDLVDRRTDVYSLGATLYEMLTRQPMFPGADRNKLLRQITSQNPQRIRQINSAVPVELETIITKAIAKDPPDRYQSAHELAADLTRFLENKPIVARRPSTFQRAAKWVQRHQQLTAVLAICLALVSVVLAISMGFVMRAETRTAAAFERTSEVLYATDMALAYQRYDSGWSDEVRSILDRYRPSRSQIDRRGLEWHLLEARTQPPGSMVLAGHDGPVNEIAVFPHGRRLASVGDDGTLRIWDVARGRLEKTVALCDSPLYSVAVSPDGRYIVAGELAVYLYDVASDAPPTTVFSGEHNVESLTFTADGSHVFAGVRYHEVCMVSLDGKSVRRIPCDSRVETLERLSGDTGILIPARHAQESSKPEHVVEHWDARLESVQAVFRAPGGAPSRFTAARVSPCGNYVLVAERYNSRLRLLRRDTGETVAETPVSRDRVSDVAYSPDGSAIAAAYDNGTWEYFQLSRGVRGAPEGVKRVHLVNAHEGNAFCLRFVNRSVIASGGADGLIRLWSLVTASTSGLSVDDERIVGMELSPDGELLLYTLPDEYIVLDVDSRQTVARSIVPDSHYSAPTWSPVGDRAAFISHARRELTMIDRSGQIVSNMLLDAESYTVDFSFDGSLVAAISQDQLEVFEFKTGKKVFDRAPLGTGNLGTLAFANKSNRVACGGEPGVIVVLDPSSRRIDWHQTSGNPVQCLAFSADDTVLATGHNDSVIRLWRAGNGELLGELAGHSQAVYSLAFSADSRSLLSSSLDGSVRIWSVDQRREYGVVVQRKYAGAFSGFPGCYLSLSADGLRLAVAYRNCTDGQSAVLLWDLPQAAHAE